MNDTTAELLCYKRIYPENADCPTEHFEYRCPCGKGKIIMENVPGFGDRYTRIECETCQEAYRVVEGCGHFWELRERM